MKSTGFTAAVTRLEDALIQSADSPDVKSIHHARTGSRRLNAALDTLKLDIGESESICKSVAKLRKLLKKVRRRAGKIRDIDVYRGLLGELVPSDEAHADVNAELRQQIAALDAKLDQRRAKAAERFQQRSAKWRDKLVRQSNTILQSLQQAANLSGQETTAVALENFALLCRDIPVLDTETLHAFRKGAKHARYIAEAGDGKFAAQTAKRLKRIQDAIGLWHDWLMLAQEARDVADGKENELVRRAEIMRDHHFESAMKITPRVRSILLAEWEAQFHGKKSVTNASSNARQKRYA